MVFQFMILPLGFFCTEFKQVYQQNGCCTAPNNNSVRLYDTSPPEAYTKYPMYELMFADEFTTFNASVWSNEFGQSGWGNEELQFYKNTITVSGGMAHLGVSRDANEIVSSRINTKYKKHFGRGIVEARIKLPNLAKTQANGLWPAFWMLGSNIDTVGWPACGEIDILEAGAAKQPSARVHAVHYQGKGSPDSHVSSLVPDISDEFHVFTLKWSNNELEFLLDDVSSWVLDITDSKYDAFRQNEFFLLLNVAVGGTFTNIFTPEEVSFSSPQSMVIDWIRIYESTAASPPSSPPSPTSSSYTGSVTLNLPKGGTYSHFVQYEPMQPKLLYLNDYWINKGFTAPITVTVQWDPCSSKYDPDWCVHKAVGLAGSNGLNDAANVIWVLGDYTPTTFKMIHGGYNPNWSQEWWNTGTLTMNRL